MPDLENGLRSLPGTPSCSLRRCCWRRSPCSPTGNVASRATPVPPPRRAAGAHDAFGERSRRGQRKEIEAIIKDYLLNNPEILLEVQNALEAKMDKIQAERTAAAIKSNAAEIFRPPFSPVVGNAKGDVTMVEFFDYNCGYCKKAFLDVAKLIEQDKQVQADPQGVPDPVQGLGGGRQGRPGRQDAGQVLGVPPRHAGQPRARPTRPSALRVAEKVGPRHGQAQEGHGLGRGEEGDRRHARAGEPSSGIQGTPHFMVGDRIIPGAPENLLEQLAKLVDEVRKEGCKVC